MGKCVIEISDSLLKKMKEKKLHLIWKDANKEEPPKTGEPFVAKMCYEKGSSVVFVVLQYDPQTGVYEDWNGYSCGQEILEWKRII